MKAALTSADSIGAILNMEACAGHDVGFHLPLLLKQKNWAGYMYYINLALLTSGSAKLKQFAAGSSFVLNKRAEKATIDRLRDAFLIFLHVYAHRHPGRAAELVESIYMFIIRDHARRFSGMGWRKKIRQEVQNTSNNFLPEFVKIKF